MTAWRRTDGVLSDVVDGRAVLIGPDGREVITLNKVGSDLWDWLVRPQSDAELVDRVVEQFDGVDPVTAAKDVGAFLAQLEEAGLAVQDR
jgi:hypothetical protein